jgi:anion-transporting  ArsA/GET3 family ATPase
MARRPAPARLDVDALLADPGTGIIVCCGSGGVGKTTTAAALGVRAAESGRRVVVLTIDPARRLAQSLGLTELDNVPRPVAGVGEVAGGSLDAMMLDMKRTFDEVVEAHSTPDKAAQILANPFYQAVSSSFAGTQEYMAMEKLSQLRAQADREGTWDLVIVDTPPSRSALDFLDAPKRLGSFLDGRFIRLLTAPARAGGRAYLKVFSGSAECRRGDDLQGARRADAVRRADLRRGPRHDVRWVPGACRPHLRLLKEPTTAFVVVAAPERDALREAAYFVERLESDGMPLAGVVVNRMQALAAPSLSGGRATAAAEQLEDAGGSELTPALLHHRAALAHDLRGALSLSLDEQGVRVLVRAVAQAGPVGKPVPQRWCNLGCGAHVYPCSARTWNGSNSAVMSTDRASSG